jgi:hypothetical protein
MRHALPVPRPSAWLRLVVLALFSFALFAPAPAAQQPVVNVPLHSTSAASRPAALRLGQIPTVFSLAAPCGPGASAFAKAPADRRSLGGGWSLVSVRRGTSTTGCQAPEKELPREWIDPDTGHRVIRLSDEPGSQSLYFHQNGYTLTAGS